LHKSLGVILWLSSYLGYDERLLLSCLNPIEWSVASTSV
jgi:hypothetical protein